MFPIAPAEPNAYFMPGADPGEGYAATNSQLFGSTTAPVPPVATNNGFVSDYSYTLGWEAKEGWSILAGTTANDIMGVFPPAMLPVLSGLANGFAVCDAWFGSAPTETLPNRAFVNAGTSQGHMDDNATKYTCPSIYGLLSSHNVTWNIYGYDEPPLTRSDFTDLLNADDSHFGLFTDFQTAAANGTLPRIRFWSQAGMPAGTVNIRTITWRLGEQLIHDVYYALRNGPAWNQTLLIVTYDEHGGCYDHVPPPSGAIPPDNSAGEYGFDFKRFGPRVPTAAGVAADRPGNGVPSARGGHAAGSHVDFEDHRNALEIAGAHRTRCRRERRRGRADSDRTAHGRSTAGRNRARGHWNEPGRRQAFASAANSC